MQLADLTCCSNERASGFIPEECWVVQVIRVRTRIHGPAIPAGVDLKHSRSAFTFCDRLREELADGAVYVAIAFLLALSVHAGPQAGQSPKEAMHSTRE